MAKDLDHLAVKLGTENTGSLLTGFLAEEDEFDRGALWRLGSWGAVAVGAVVVAALANQTSLAQRRDQIAAADLSRQAAQLQLATRESQSETRRLASAKFCSAGSLESRWSSATSSRISWRLAWPNAV